ncbi:hypothetical protein [Telluribacter humicola]|uniref:hypothetical protein n=1 Tax=Telluribacter humicola TaxID=1720261 RepID=UPI001A9614E7|nr:hypothetical protein [Telluribacter humicola]
MKRLLFSLIVTALVTGSAHAQQSFILSLLKHKGFVSTTAGYSIPTLSPFGKNNEKMMGYGKSAQASVGYRLGRHLGVVTTYSYTTNTIRKDVLLASTTTTGVEINTWEARASDCSLQTLMVGPMLTFNLGRFMLDAQLTGGYSLATSPRTELHTEFAQLPLSMITPSQNTEAIAAGAGLMLHYKLNRWLAAQASAHYITADLKYENLAKEVTIGKQHTTEVLPSSQPVGLLNVGGGLSILF